MRRRAALALASGVLASFGVMVACSAETGPDAPARTNGCIDCPAPDSGIAASTDATTTTSDAPQQVVFGDPLAGTTKAVTLVKGKVSFAEGPVWIGGRLLFSDIVANLVNELTATDTTTVFRSDSNATNGLAVDAEGRLFACEGSAKRVTRSPGTKGAATTPIAEIYEGNPFNSPNDVIVRADGNVYFTDPNYGPAENRTQDAEATYRINPAGNVSRLDFAFERPNGIALSPDGATLYVVDNGAGKLYAGAVGKAGAVPSFASIADVPGGDGIAVDDAGNLYVATDAGITVLDRSGASIGTVTVPVKPTNCTFGGTDRQTLYVTAGAPPPEGGAARAATGIYSLRLNVPGLP